MPDFSADEKVAVRNYLGFSELYHDLDPRLESQLSGLYARSPESVDLVRVRLTELADIRTRLGLALDNLDLVQAEDVTFLGPMQLDALRDHGRMLIQSIAIMFDLVPLRDVFATYGDDGYGGPVPIG
jgi:hypothetical protein